MGKSLNPRCLYSPSFEQVVHSFSCISPPERGQTNSEEIQCVTGCTAQRFLSSVVSVGLLSSVTKTPKKLKRRCNSNLSTLLCAALSYSTWTPSGGGPEGGEGSGSGSLSSHSLSHFAALPAYSVNHQLVWRTPRPSTTDPASFFGVHNSLFSLPLSTSEQVCMVYSQVLLGLGFCYYGLLASGLPIFWVFLFRLLTKPKGFLFTKVTLNGFQLGFYSSRWVSLCCLPHVVPFGRHLQPVFVYLSWTWTCPALRFLCVLDEQ